MVIGVGLLAERDGARVSHIFSFVARNNPREREPRSLGPTSRGRTGCGKYLARRGEFRLQHIMIALGDCGVDTCDKLLDGVGRR